MSAITSETISITPAIATEWLVNNSRNRQLSEDLVVNYAAEMEAGHWALNGESIKFDNAGRMIDGQHRLRAIILFGKPVKILVTRGIDPAAFDTLDCGKKRTAADVLSIKGVKYSVRISGALGWIWRFVTDTVEKRSRKPATRTVEEALEKYPEVKAVTEMVGDNVNHIISTPLVIALYVLFRRHNVAVADQWFSALKDGCTEADNHTMFILREKLIRNRSEKARLPAEELAAYCIKCFNALLDEDEIRFLKKVHGETFPRIGERYDRKKKKFVKVGKATNPTTA
jgi:hypothetical protein